MSRNPFGQGTNDALQEIIGGFIFAMLVSAFANSNLLPPEYILLFGLFNVIGTSVLLFTLTYAGASYLVGWLFGAWIMLDAGLIGWFSLECLIYFIIPIVIGCIRFYIWIKNQD